MSEQTTLAAISYAHGAYDDVVLALSDKLRSKGVDCEIDAYEDSPPQGWLQWMEEMMLKRTVLVVCTETYARRLRGDELPGVGRGAAWEGRYIKQRVYDGQGRNEGVVPIVFASGDLAHVPPFIKDVTYYDLSQPDGFKRLYRRLTRQSAHPRPPLGPIEHLEPERSASEARFSGGETLGLFDTSSGRIAAEIVSIARDRSQIRIDARASMENARRLILMRDGHGKSVAVAYRLDCYLGRIRDVSHTVQDGRDSIQIVLDEERLPPTGGITEMGYSNVSSDEIALMRAKRILLDEPLPERFSSDRLMNQIVAGAIGREARIEVQRSNIPDLSRQIEDDAQFTAIARLDCVLQLTLSGTVERVERLEVLRDAKDVTVDFIGYRGRVYSNRESVKLEVTGTWRVK